MTKLKIRNSLKGFTIVELIVVIVVVGILATVSIVAYGGIQAKARDASVLSDGDGLSGEIVRAGIKNNGLYSAALQWYSPNGVNSNIGFTPTSGNIIDIVTNSTDYCIRVFNSSSVSFKSLATAAVRESKPGICNTLPASAAAIAAAPAEPGTTLVWTQRTSAGSKIWQSVTMSNDGTKIAAIANGNNYIYTSNDSGATWVARTGAGLRSFSSLTASGNGTKIVASSGSDIYTSVDSGLSWIQRVSPNLYSAAINGLVITPDGTKLYSGDTLDDTSPGSGKLYMSTDLGVSWTLLDAPNERYWMSLASSSDGVKLVAGAKYSLYTSSNSGATWVDRTFSAGGYFQYVASSSDGTKLLASIIGSQKVFTSTNSGVSWTENTSVSGKGVFPVAISSNGTRLVIGTFFGAGSVYTSINSGGTWTERTDNGSKQWNSVAISGDGTRMVALSNTYIYTALYQ